MKEFQTIEDIGLAIEQAKRVLRRHRALVTNIQQALAKSKSLTELEIIDSPSSRGRVSTVRKQMDPDRLRLLEQKWDELQALYKARKDLEMSLIALEKPGFKITPTYSAMLSQAQATLLEIKTVIENTKRLLRTIGKKAMVPAFLKSLAEKVIERVRATVVAQSYTLTVTAHPTPKNDMFHYYAMIELTSVMLGKTLYDEYFIILTCDEDQKVWSVGTTTNVTDIGKIRNLRTVSLDGKPKVAAVFKGLNLLMSLDNLAPIASLPLKNKLGALPPIFSKALFIDEDLWLVPAKRIPVPSLEDGTDNPEYKNVVSKLREAASQMIYDVFGISNRLSIGTEVGFVTVDGKKRRALKVRVADLGFKQLNVEQIEQIGELLNLKAEQINAIKKLVL